MSLKIRSKEREWSARPERTKLLLTSRMAVDAQHRQVARKRLMRFLNLVSQVRILLGALLLSDLVAGAVCVVAADLLVGPRPPFGLGDPHARETAGLVSTR